MGSRRGAKAGIHAAASVADYLWHSPKLRRAHLPKGSSPPFSTPTFHHHHTPTYSTHHHHPSLHAQRLRPYFSSRQNCNESSTFRFTIYKLHNPSGTCYSGLSSCPVRLPHTEALHLRAAVTILLFFHSFSYL